MDGEKENSVEEYATVEFDDSEQLKLPESDTKIANEETDEQQSTKQDIPSEEEEKLLTREERSEMRRKRAKKMSAKAVSNIDSAMDVGSYGFAATAAGLIYSGQILLGICSFLVWMLFNLAKYRLGKGSVRQYLEDNDTVFSKNLSVGGLSYLAFGMMIIFLDRTEYYAAAFALVVSVFLGFIKHRLPESRTSEWLKSDDMFLSLTMRKDRHG